MHDAFSETLFHRWSNHFFSWSNHAIMNHVYMQSSSVTTSSKWNRAQRKEKTLKKRQKKNVKKIPKTTPKHERNTKKNKHSNASRPITSSVRADHLRLRTVPSALSVTDEEDQLLLGQLLVCVGPNVRHLEAWGIVLPRTLLVFICFFIRIF